MKNKSMRVKKIAAWMLVMILACSIGKPVNVKAASKSFTSSEVANYFMSRVGERYPSGYCLKFVSDTFANMGAARSSTCCAFNYGNSHITSTNRDNIPIGADVFFGSCGGGPCDTCKSSYYGHIGVYVGNGYFVHATGGTVQKTSLTGTSWNNKYRGWGYHSNITVSQTSVDNDTHNSDREPFRFSVDQAPVHGTVFHSPGERFSMAGWTLTTYGRGEGVTCVNLIINGKDVVNCSRNQRDDVANVFPDYPNKNAGFYCDVSADLLNPGPNKIALRAYATNLNHNDILIGDFGERTVYYEPAACSLEG